MQITWQKKRRYGMQKLIRCCNASANHTSVVRHQHHSYLGISFQRLLYFSEMTEAVGSKPFTMTTEASNTPLVRSHFIELSLTYISLPPLRRCFHANITCHRFLRISNQHLLCRPDITRSHEPSRSCEEIQSDPVHRICFTAEKVNSCT